MKKTKVDIKTGEGDEKVWMTIAAVKNVGPYESYKLEAGYSLTIGSEDPMHMLKDMEMNLREMVLQAVQDKSVDKAFKDRQRKKRR